MDLRDRLRKMLGSEAVAAASAPPGIREPLGNIIEREEGSFVKRELRYPLSHQHGDHRFEEVLGLDPAHVAILAADRALDGFDVRRAVFLDVETTSLSGGAGTYVFLTGVAWIDGNELRLTQYFMRDFDEEVALLHELRDDLRAFEFIVTFFGKNFDRHRLADRFAMHGLESTLPERHLDLCHAGRRLFQGGFPDVRLKTLERFLLGLARHGDLPGAECAQTYFDFLCGRDDGRLQLVFQHNLIDVLSLVTLAVRLERCVRAPSSALDYLGAGRAFERVADLPAAVESFQRASAGDLPTHLRAIALARVGALARKLKRRAVAQAAFEELRSLMPYSHEAPFELARLCEREAPAASLAYLEEAIAKLEQLPSIAVRVRGRELEAMQRRRDRLLRRQAKPVD